MCPARNPLTEEEGENGCSPAGLQQILSINFHLWMLSQRWLSAYGKYKIYLMYVLSNKLLPTPVSSHLRLILAAGAIGATPPPFCSTTSRHEWYLGALICLGKPSKEGPKSQCVHAPGLQCAVEELQGCSPWFLWHAPANDDSLVVSDYQ